MHPKEKDFFSIYRPLRMEREINDRKVRIQKEMVGISKKLRTDSEHLLRRIEGRRNFDTSNKSVNRLSRYPS